MSSLLRRVGTTPPKIERYQPLNFSRNPFPNKPGIKINGPDDRENGSIYFPDLRQKEAEQFDNILIPHPQRSEVKSIAFLMDYATKQGRGIGKTAFLNYENKEVNKDLGSKKSNDSSVIFSIYCSPSPGDQRKFWQICQLIIQSMIEQDILSLAMCRIRAYHGGIPDIVLSSIESSNLREILSEWDLIQEKFVLLSEQIDSDKRHLSENDSNNFLKRIFEANGIDTHLTNRFVMYGYNQVITMKTFFSKVSETEWRKNAVKWLFEDFVKIMQLAGFTKGIFLFDELEKVIQYQNTQERRAFCDDLRYYFIDGNSYNTKTSFFSILLVIHPYLQELLNPHWNAAGLERFAPLGGTNSPEFTVFFRPIRDDQAVPLAKAYMEKSRINSSDNPLFPFSDEALILAHSKNSGIPGKYLTFLHLAIERAIDKNWSSIGIKEVEELSLSSLPIEETTETTTSLPSPEVNLNNE